MNVFGILRIVLLAIATILCCVGTGVAQIRKKDGDVESLVYLYKTGAKSPLGSAWTKTEDIDCKAIKQRMQAAYAFAIISCIVIGVALILVILSMFVSAVAKIGKLGSLALSVVGMITSLIAWAIVVGTFHGKFCGAEASAKQGGFKLYAGAALLIVTWILMIIDVIVAVLGFLGILGSGSDSVAEANM